MKTLTVTALLAMCVAAPVHAARYVSLMNYLSRAEAASAIAGTSTETLVSTGSTIVPFIQVNVFYCNAPVGIVCSGATPPASPIPIQWHEFTSGDSWCRSTLVPPGSSVTQCAAFYYGRVLPQFKRVGLFTTSEHTPVLWWFND